MKKVILINILIVTGIFVINVLITRGDTYFFFGRFALTGVISILSGIINLFIGLSKMAIKDEGAKFYILMGGLFLLIGYSVCSIK
jgi:hypothetical protein